MEHLLIEISVIICTHNRASLLMRALSSVLTQSVPAHEIIIWDDGSTDNTAELVSQYSSHKIRYFRHNNTGKSISLNKAIEKATGHWIAILDDDDYWDPMKLEVQRSFIDEFPDVDIVFTNYENVNIINEEKNDGFSQNKLAMSKLEKNINIKNNGWMISAGWDDAITISNFILPSTTLIRKGIFGEIGGFSSDLRNSEDLDYWWRCYFSGKKFGGIDTITTTREKNSDSLSSPSLLMNINHYNFLNALINKGEFLLLKPKLQLNYRLQVRRSICLILAFALIELKIDIFLSYIKRSSEVGCGFFDFCQATISVFKSKAKLLRAKWKKLPLYH